MAELSRTCIFVAAARALGAREPDPAVRNPDYLAEKLIAAADLALIAEAPLAKYCFDGYESAKNDSEAFPTIWMMLARTRFIDDALQRAVASGVSQVVFLGAGLDTRAYRLRDLLHSCKVVEADAPATQQHKLERLNRAGIPRPDNLTYCALDLLAPDLSQTLQQAGLDPREPTFFTLEGVVMYLPEATVRKTLRAIAAFGGPGTRLVVDYHSAKNPEIAHSMFHHRFELFARWGEPWLFSVLQDPSEFFASQGLRLVQNVTFMDPAFMAKYLTASNGEVFGRSLFQQMREEAIRKAAALGEAPPQAPEPFYWFAETAHA